MSKEKILQKENTAILMAILETNLKILHKLEKKELTCEMFDEVLLETLDRNHSFIRDIINQEFGFMESEK